LLKFPTYHTVLARKASRLIGAHELAALGRGALALRREGLGRRQVADESKSLRNIQMNTFSISEAIAPEYSHAFGRTLSMDELRHSSPAVFAENASARTKSTYRFINTAEVLQALLEAGFQPSAAQQTRSRSGSDPTYARHMIRLRRTCESLTLVDCIPELSSARDNSGNHQH
jgi:hypothetical protein